jgi:regulator of nucleoside diphosphate kinase
MTVQQRAPIITSADRRRLGTLIDTAAQDRLVERRYLNDLEAELERATAIEPQEVPADVITMNSEVRLRDLDADEALEFTLVYPRDASPNEGRVSVLAPIGTAIIGYRTGDVIEWQVPAGTVRLKVEEVVYQPESAGDYER